MTNARRARANRKSAPAPEEAPEQIAERSAAADRALLSALQQRDSKPAPRKATIADNFASSVIMIAEAKSRYRLSENTLLKLYELNVMWALNNRQTVEADSPFGPDLGESGGPGEGDVELPEPHEVILGADDTDADSTETE